MIHPALLLLLRLRAFSIWRRVRRSLTSVRGVLMGAFTVLLLGSLLAPALLSALVSGSAPNVGLSAGAKDMLPMGLFAFCLMLIATSAGEKAIYFSPSEVDFLFAGPFNRRELLIYKLISTGFVGLVMSVFMLPGMILTISSPLAGFIGIFMALTFIRLVGMSFALLAQTVEEHLFSRGRKVIVAVLLLLVGLGVWQVMANSDQASLSDFATAFRHSWAGAILLAPFSLFTELITADRFLTDGLQWLGLALLMNGGLLAIVLWLDANYLEAAAAVSQKLYDRMQRVRRGGGLTHNIGRKVPTRVPRLPWIGGIGPIFWRQMVITVRSVRNLIMLVVVVGVVLGLQFVLTRSHTDSFSAVEGLEEVSPFGGSFVPSIIVGALVYTAFLASMQLPFGFRGDLDHMDSLKALPISPLAISVGQISGVVLLLTAMQLVVLLCAIPLTEGGTFVLLLAAGFTLPFNLSLIASESLVFLYYPTRLAPGSPGDIQFLARIFLAVIVKGLLLMPCAGAAVCIGAIAYLISGYSWIAFASTSWLVSMAINAGLLGLVAHAFQRFDPSVHTPP